MDEKRRAERTMLESKLIIKALGKDVEEKETETDIEIIDVSKNGVGFSCKEKLEIGEVYEGFLTIWTKEVLHCFMEIVRIEKEGDGFVYGAIFIGMPEMETQRIEVYQTVAKNVEN